MHLNALARSKIITIMYLIKCILVDQVQHNQKLYIDLDLGDSSSSWAPRSPPTYAGRLPSAGGLFFLFVYLHLQNINSVWCSLAVISRNLFVTSYERCILVICHRCALYVERAWTYCARVNGCQSYGDPSLVPCGCA